MTTPIAEKLYPKFNVSQQQLALIPDYNKQWIDNALSCKPIESDRDEIRRNIISLYACAGLPAPKNIVFVPSPFVLTFAGGFAAAIWHIRKTGFLFNKGDATCDATCDATRDATRDDLVNFLLACANTSGHFHGIKEVKGLEFHKLEDVLYVVNNTKKSVLLEHQEHHSIEVEPGITEFGPIHEMDHLARMERKVID